MGVSGRVRMRTCVRVCVGSAQGIRAEHPRPGLGTHQYLRSPASAAQVAAVGQQVIVIFIHKQKTYYFYSEKITKKEFVFNSLVC